MYSAFRSERPAVRRKGTEAAATTAGDGKYFGGGGWVGEGKSPMNLFLMLAAAAPDTFTTV